MDKEDGTWNEIRMIKPFAAAAPALSAAFLAAMGSAIEQSIVTGGPYLLLIPLQTIVMLASLKTIFFMFGRNRGAAVALRDVWSLHRQIMFGCVAGGVVVLSGGAALILRHLALVPMNMSVFACTFAASAFFFIIVTCLTPRPVEVKNCDVMFSLGICRGMAQAGTIQALVITLLTLTVVVMVTASPIEAILTVIVIAAAMGATAVNPIRNGRRIDGGVMVSPTMTVARIWTMDWNATRAMQSLIETGPEKEALRAGLLAQSAITITMLRKSQNGPGEIVTEPAWFVSGLDESPETMRAMEIVQEYAKEHDTRLICQIGT